MNRLQLRLTDMWLIALCPEQNLGQSARMHIEQVLGDEYRMQANAAKAARHVHDQAA